MLPTLLSHLRQIASLSIGDLVLILIILALIAGTVSQSGGRR